MIVIKQKKLDLIRFIFLMLILTACNSNSSIIGNWNVESRIITIKDEFRYILDASPGVLENKFNRMFPNGLKDGDYLEIDNNKFTINFDKEFNYRKMDTTIHIMSMDIVFPLKYKLKGNKLILSRETHQGNVEWTLKNN